jgi:hypothetical protein
MREFLFSFETQKNVGVKSLSLHPERKRGGEASDILVPRPLLSRERGR